PSRRRHTRLQGDWSSDVCSSDLRVNVFNTVTIAAQLANQFRYALDGFGERLGPGDLRPDVHADPRNREMPVRRGPGIELPRLLDRYTELMLVKPGGDIRVCLSRDVRIHPQRNGGFLFQPCSTFPELPQF